MVREVFAWALLSFLTAMSMRALRPMPLQDDSYQYLSTADNLNHARGVSTSLVHFDTERSHGVVPAPLTTFPPAYPVAVAEAGRLTGNLEAAGRLLSVLCFAGTAALLAWALILSGTGVFVRQILLCLFTANAVNLEYATGVLTEPMYMLASTAAVVLLLWAQVRPSRLAVVAAYTLAGLGYWIRYAGLFLIAALLCYAVVRVVRDRGEVRLTYAGAALIPLVLAGLLMGRNYLSVGTWKGGNDLPVHNSFQSVAAGYVRAQWHLLTGEHALKLGVWEVLLLVGVVAVVLLAVRMGRPPFGWSLVLILLCLGVYSLGIVYAGLTSSISFVTRMFLPLLPLYAMLAARLLPARAGVGLKAALCLLLAGYAGSNARDLAQPLPRAEDQTLAAELAGLRPWLDAHVPASETVFAADGQAVGFVLHRPVVSLVGARYSREQWECGPLKAEMSRFHSHYVILYKSAPPDSNSAQSQFLDAPLPQQLACGFTVAAEDNDLRVLQRTDAQ